MKESGLTRDHEFEEGSGPLLKGNDWKGVHPSRELGGQEVMCCKGVGLGGLLGEQRSALFNSKPSTKTVRLALQVTYVE